MSARTRCRQIAQHELLFFFVMSSWGLSCSLSLCLVSAQHKFHTKWLTAPHHLLGTNPTMGEVEQGMSWGKVGAVTDLYYSEYVRHTRNENRCAMCLQLLAIRWGRFFKRGLYDDWMFFLWCRVVASLGANCALIRRAVCRVMSVIWKNNECVLCVCNVFLNVLNLR